MLSRARARARGHGERQRGRAHEPRHRRFGVRGRRPAGGRRGRFGRFARGGWSRRRVVCVNPDTARSACARSPRRACSAAPSLTSGAPASTFATAATRACARRRLRPPSSAGPLRRLPERRARLLRHRAGRGAGSAGRRVAGGLERAGAAVAARGSGGGRRAPARRGANDPAVKPGADGTAALVNAPSPLGELFAFVVSRWNGVSTESNAPTTLAEATLRPNANPAATHRLVAPVFLETCARYHLAVARNPSALLLPALAAFLDARARHADPEVGARVLPLARFVKPLRQQIAACLPEALAAMERWWRAPWSRLQTRAGRAARRRWAGARRRHGQQRERRRLRVRGAGVFARHGGCQVAGGGAGLLDREGVRACAHGSGGHERRGRGDVRAVHRGVRERRQGFSSRLATEIGPGWTRAGRGLAPATACLACFDAASDPTGSAGVLRQRVVAFSAVGCRASRVPVRRAPRGPRARLGSAATSRSASCCATSSARRSSDWRPPAAVTETLLAQTARAHLAPFTSPDGHTHGVLGMFARRGRRPERSRVRTPRGRRR